MGNPLQLSRRERQIMEVLYARGAASVNELVGEMPDPPSHTAVRTFLRILAKKGHVTRRRVGKEHLYKPTRPRGQVAKGALRSLLGTFFGGSIEKALAMHLADPGTRLNEDDIQRLHDLIAQAYRKGE